jgi:hypothetical protein
MPADEEVGVGVGVLFLQPDPNKETKIKRDMVCRGSNSFIRTIWVKLLFCIHLLYRESSNVRFVDYR